MNSSENDISQIKNPKTNENIINLCDSGSKKIEEGSQRTPSLKAFQLKEKEKTRIKNAILKKINTSEKDEEIKNVKVKDLIDDKFIKEYDPLIQDNDKNKKLNFFIDCKSCSESDQDLSSPSISDTSMDKDEDKKEIIKEK